jgi:4-hydroxy-3-polyprenylbenzoate decarboxylase
VGPAEEHTNLVGIPTEASIIRLVENSMPGRLANVYCHSSGGGKYLAILQFRKLSERDEGSQRQAALTAFAAFPGLKHVILVDDDVNIYDTNDVLWAMTTRYQGDAGTGRRVSDCTLPCGLRERFRRPEFLPVDLARFGDLTGRA